MLRFFTLLKTFLLLFTDKKLLFFSLPAFLFIIYSVLTSSMLRNIVLKIISAEQMTKDTSLNYRIPNTSSFKGLRLKTIDNMEIGAWVIEPREINDETEHCILFHGNSLNRKRFMSEFGVYDMIIKHNLVLMIPDYRGFGDSQGQFEFNTVHYDIDAAFECFKMLYPKKRIHFISFSLGGTVVLEYMAFVNNPLNVRQKHPQNEDSLNNNFFTAEILYMNKPDLIILVSPFISLSETITRIMRKFYLINRFVGFLTHGLERLINLEPYKSIDFLSKENTLLIYSDNDHLISVKSLEKLIERVEYKLMPGLCHVDTFSVSSWDLIMNFIKKR